MVEQSPLVDQYTAALTARDVDVALKLYADDAVVVRYEGVAQGRSDIRAFLIGLLAAHDRFDLVSVDQVKVTDDVVIWDATIETGAGMVQTTNVCLLDEQGAIVRHVPFIRGYWGRT